MAWIELLGPPGVGKTTQLGLLKATGFIALGGEEQSLFSGEPLQGSVEDAIVGHHLILSRKAIALTETGKVVTDFSLTSDLAYGKVRFTGEDEIAFASRTLGAMAGLNRYPDLQVVMSVDPVAILLTRITNRVQSEPSRDFELGYSEEYLADITRAIAETSYPGIPRIEIAVANGTPEDVHRQIYPRILEFIS